jgi:exopolyphosphatase / guanosine-5'-triphosphate,3'-diphosphate pyrophosphatase
MDFIRVICSLFPNTWFSREHVHAASLASCPVWGMGLVLIRPRLDDCGRAPAARSRSPWPPLRPEMTPVAIIDIGSNSIKVLVAHRAGDGRIAPLKIRTIDARISAGISRDAPRLADEGMARGIEAIRALLADAAEFSPGRIRLVATSAVRDAQNGAEFRARVRDATGHEVRVLSGHEEAGLIGRGLTCDPALREQRDFYVFDLGGGSLECLAFRDRTIEQAMSLQLGCVRLTEKFVADPTQPFSEAEAGRVVAHTRDVFASAGFAFSLPRHAVAVGSGGTVTTARTILGNREGRSFEETSPVITTAELRQLLAWLAALPLRNRKQISGLPPGRADIFPVALATLVALADIGGFSAYQNSVYNLRYGVAAELLEETGRNP